MKNLKIKHVFNNLVEKAKKIENKVEEIMDFAETPFTDDIVIGTKHYYIMK